MELDELLKLIRAVSDSELTGFKYEAEGVCLNLKKEKEVVTAVQTLPAAGVSQSVMPLQAVAASAMSEASADSEEKAAGGCGRYREERSDSSHCGSHEADE